jgi:CDP-glucose 4,6-dehydratase
MHFLVTGHTGFKGSWLTLLLKQRGHTVSGLALAPLPGSLFERAQIAQDLEDDFRLDIRDVDATRRAVAASSADVVVHLAAQPLVRESYRNPRYTYEVNVNGTLHVLDALQDLSTLRTALVVTTDKVYRIDGRRTPYRETDALGGVDPYSTSKAMADLLTQSWMRTSVRPIAIARAGNVIGGGDVCAERLMPDLVAAQSVGRPVTLRHPDAVRPWQHVLDCLNGYLAIIEHTLAIGAGDAWNIGPDASAEMTVGQVASLVAELWGSRLGWQHEPPTAMHETDHLSLDVDHAKQELGWQGVLDTPAAVKWTVDWHRKVGVAGPAREFSLEQVSAFSELTARSVSHDR